MTDNELQISFAPLQGFTDYIYRSAFQKYFDGVDKFFIPYVRYNNNDELKSSYKCEIIQDNNSHGNTVPQILSNKAAELIKLAEYLKHENFRTLNWNLGCPYPMVAKQNLGSGLLPQPDTIKLVLDEYYKVAPLPLSVKMRLGYESPDEFFSVLKVFNNFPVSEIIIHPRIGKQLYKGHAKPDYFAEALQFSKHKLVYNGDIQSIEDFEVLRSLFPSQKSWMIGRALLSNPFLAEQIKHAKSINKEQKAERLQLFTNELLEKYTNKLSGQSHLLTKMTQHWSYLSQMFENEKKVYKLILKSRKLENYLRNIYEIFGGRFSGLK